MKSADLTLEEKKTKKNKITKEDFINPKAKAEDPNDPFSTLDPLSQGTGGGYRL